MNIHISPAIEPAWHKEYTFSKIGGYSCYGHPAIVRLLKQDFAALIIEKPPQEAVIKSRPNLIYKVPFPGGPAFPFPGVVVKKCVARNLLQLFSSLFQKSKAQRSFIAAAELIKARLDTPLPLAYMEKRTGGFVLVSYYITEAVDDFMKVRTYLKTWPDAGEIHDMVRAVAEFSRRMHDAGMMHRDLNLTNFLLCGKDDTRRLTLVDLNRLRTRRRLSSFSRVLDIGRLYWDNYRPEFFRIYSGTDKNIQRWEWFFNFYYVWRRKRRAVKDWLGGKGRRKKVKG